MLSRKFIFGLIFIVIIIFISVFLYINISNNDAKNSTSIQDNSKMLTSTDILGKYNNISLKRSELTTQERQTLFEVESQTYNAIENILTKRYYDSLIKDFMKSNNITNSEIAEQMFIQKNSTVTNEQVKKFIKENSENPQLKGKTFEQQMAIVKPYLDSQAAKFLVAQAILNGKIEVSGVSKPLAPKISIDIGNSPSRGPANAQVTIIEFADFQCPFCAKAHPIIEEILNQYKEKVRFVFKNYPLIEIHPEAIPAAIAAECANKQEKYWQMHDSLFENHRKLGEETYVKIAKSIGLKIDEFNKCRKDQQIHDKINAERKYGQTLGINATPAFYINGVQFIGTLPKIELEKIINNELVKH